MNVIPDDIDFQTWYDMMEPVVKVRSAADCMDALIDEIKNPSQIKPVLMPWSKTSDLFQFRPGEVTVFAGTNGSGKSLITGQIALSLVGQNVSIVTGKQVSLSLSLSLSRSHQVSGGLGMGRMGPMEVTIEYFWPRRSGALQNVSDLSPKTL